MNEKHIKKLIPDGWTVCHCQNSEVRAIKRKLTLEIVYWSPTDSLEVTVSSSGEVLSELRILNSSVNGVGFNQKHLSAFMYKAGLKQ